MSAPAGPSSDGSSPQDRLSSEPAAATPSAATAETTPATGSGAVAGSASATDSAPASGSTAGTGSAPAGSVPVSSAPTADTDPAPGRPSRVASLLPLLLVGLLTVAMIAGVVFLALRLRSASAAEDAREEAVAASRDAARVLFSYDHATLDADFERGKSVTTGEFQGQYAKTTEVLAPVARQVKAVVVADVIESAIVDASADKATTLVFLNQATTSTEVEGRKVDQSRVRMTLVDVDGEWKVSKVDAL